MKMVKSLLLGSAAGVVAMAGAQAADLPVKAKPVQYVKICNLYGAGFYYIPGTDMCLKVGGWARAEYGWGQNGNFAWGWANGNVNNRTTNNSDFRARGYITVDARNQTEYGTVRAYLAIGLSENDVGFNTASNTFSANRAFIQLAGFTFGRSQSFFDFYSVPATSYWGAFPASDTGDPGWMVMGYTAQFGNGLSASLAAEERRTTQIINDNIASNRTEFNPAFPASYGGFQWPDVVANLRVDQSWGSAQLMGAVHDVNATYYGPSSNIDPRTGHPDDKVGWVVGGGIKVLAPWVSPGDYFQAQVNYSEGAVRYVFQTPNSNWGFINGTQVGFGVLSDSVFGGQLGSTGAHAPGDQQLTTAWGVNAAYEHFWSKQWKTSVYGGYAAVSYNDVATNLLCFADGGNHGPVTGCDMNWNTWWVGSRTQWNVSQDTYIGLDVLYQNLQSATLPGVSVPIGSPAWVSAVDDQHNWSARFRVHKDFYP